MVFKTKESGSRKSLTISSNYLLLQVQPCRGHVTGIKMAYPQGTCVAPRPSSGSDAIFKVKIFLSIEFYHQLFKITKN